MKTAPVPAVSVAGETSRPATATSSSARRRSLEAFATLAVAVVTAFLLWVVMGPSTPDAVKAASPLTAAPPADTAASVQPAAIPAPLAPIPRPADAVAAAPAAPAAPAVAAAAAPAAAAATAAPAAPAAPAAAAAPAEKRAVCSAAHEAAGLCNSQ